MDTTTDTVRREVTVAADAARAFSVFTEGFATWWPKSHSLGTDQASVAIEPGVGGRWYEQAADGTEIVWGEVLAWDPPHRVVLTWQLDGEFDLDPDPAHASEVEVTFSEADGRTTVVLEHRHFERNRTPAEQSRDGVAGEGGWSTLLEMFAAAVGQTPAGEPADPHDP